MNFRIFDKKVLQRLFFVELKYLKLCMFGLISLYFTFKQLQFIKNLKASQNNEILESGQFDPYSANCGVKHIQRMRVNLNLKRSVKSSLKSSDISQNCCTFNRSDVLKFHAIFPTSTEGKN